MKRLFFVFAAIAAILSSCKKEEVQPEAVITLKSASEVSVVAEASAETIKFETNVSWSAFSDVNWVTLDKESGEGGTEEQTINLTIAANELQSARVANVTIRAGKLEGKVAITQAAAPKPAGIYNISDLRAFADSVAKGASLEPFSAN